MPKPSTPSKGRSLSLTEVKILFLSLAVAATLGIWSLLARQADQAAVASNASPVPDGNPPTPDLSSNTLVLVLSPLPTLIPPEPEPVNLNLPVQVPTAVMVSQQPAAPAVQAPVKIFLGGAKPSAPRANRRVVTVTRSS